MEFQRSYNAPSTQSSLPNVEWHGGSSGHCEAKMEVVAVVKKGGREKKSQKRRFMQGDFQVQT
jgi:hypothetical protein